MTRAIALFLTCCTAFLAATGCSEDDDSSPLPLVPSLRVDKGANSPVAANVSPSASHLSVFQVRLTAGAAEDVAVASLRFTEKGTGDAQGGLSAVELFVDADGDGAYSPAVDVPALGSLAAYAGDDSANFTAIARTIPAGISESWILVYTFSGSPSAGTTFAASVDAAADVTAAGASSAKPAVATGVPADGNTMTVQSFGSLSLSLGANTPAAGNLPYPPTLVPLLQVRLEAGTETVTVSSITFTAGGTGDANGAVAQVWLYNDLDGSGTVTGGDIPIGAPVAFSGGRATFSGIAEGIATGAGSAEHWLVACTFSGGAGGDTFTVSLSANADVTATGSPSTAAIVPTGAPVQGHAKTRPASATLAVSAGANSPVAGNLPSPPVLVPMLQLRLQAGASEAAVVSSITVTAGGTGTADTAVTEVRLYNDPDGSGTITAGDTQIGASTAFTSGTAVFAGLSESVAAGAAGAETWLVACTFAGGNANDTFSVGVAASGDVSATGAATGWPAVVSGPPVSGNLLTLGALTITTRRLPFAMQNAAYNFALQSAGGIPPLAWSVSAGSLPSGLALAAGSGVLSGTVSSGASGQIFTVQVLDSGTPQQSDTQLLAIEVDPQGTTIVSVIQAGGGTYSTIGAALAALPNPLAGTYVIEIRDSATYNENLDVNFTTGTSTANLVIRSKYDCLPTVRASNANDHVFDLQRNGIAVWGLAITGATGSGMCGIRSSSWNTGIVNNVIFGNDVAIDNTGAPGTTIVNNTCYGPNGLHVGGGGSCMVRNNIVWATATGGWAIQWYTTGAFSSDYNLLYAPNGDIGLDAGTPYTTLAAWQTHTGGDANSQSGNPNLANPSGGDFHLTASSTLAIDRGTTSFGLFTDAEGYARGHGAAWDIGAFERN